MIRRKILILFFIMLAFSQIVFADTEFWSLTTFQFPFREKVKLNLIPELRFRNNAGELYYFQTYIGPALLISKSFEMDLYYALNYSKGTNGWNSKSLGYLDAIYRTDFPWFLFSNRGRFEYDLSLNVLKYRNLFGFSKNGWFASDELFYNFNQGFFDEGRSSIGYSTKIFGNVSLSLSYMLRRQRQSPTADWQRTNVVNLGLKVNL